MSDDRSERVLVLRDFVLPEAQRVARRKVIEGENVRVMLFTLAPGQRLPPHRHPGHEVILHALEGSVTLLLDEERLELSAGRLTHCSGEVQVELRNDSGGPAALLVTLVARRSTAG